MLGGGYFLLEQGDDYWIASDCIGCNYGESGVGAVITLYEFEFIGKTKGYAIRSTILDVLVFEDGWTYQVKKDGGLDASVEIIMENPTCMVKYKSKVQPGKTVVDHGKVKCK